MTHGPVVFGGFVLVVVLLAAVLGAVERGERVPFVGGVGLVILASTLGSTGTLPGSLGGGLAVLGFLAIAWSVVPLLRQSPTTS